MDERCAAIRFGTDGWRGIIADDCTVDTVRCVGRAYLSWLRDQGATQRPRVVVGFDRRFASDLFARALVEVLTRGGVDALLCRDPVPTPVVSFVVTQLGADGGLMVTASHNPARYNGIKVKTASGASAPPEVYRELEQRLRQGVPDQVASPPGNVTEIRPVEAYLEHLERVAPVDPVRRAGFTVLVDPMFGAMAGLLSRLLQGDLTKCVEINTAHNPLFPGIRGPEPVEQNLGKLARAVVDGRATIGLAFDGDGDRVGVVDERGHYVNAQRVFALLAYYLLDVRRLRGPLVRSVNGTAMLDRLAQRYGVSVIETPNGFPYLAKAMQVHRAILAGEESGGFATALHVPERDGLLSGLMLLDLLRVRDTTLSGVLQELESITGTWTYRRVDVPLARGQRDAVADYLGSVPVPERLAGLAVVDESRLDGVKLYLEDGSWVLVRPSGTEPLLRLYVESPDAGLVEPLIDETRRWLGIGTG